MKTSAAGYSVGLYNSLIELAVASCWAAAIRLAPMAISPGYYLLISRYDSAPRSNKLFLHRQPGSASSTIYLANSMVQCEKQ